MKVRKRVLVYSSVHAAGEVVILPYGHNRTLVFDKTGRAKRVVAAGKAAMGSGGRDFRIGNLYHTMGIEVKGGAVNWAAGGLGAK